MSDRAERREERAWWARITLPAAGLTVAGLLALIAWLLLRPDVDRLEPITTVNEAGDTVVYSGRVRDAVARARIIEALNSVPVRAEDTVDGITGSDSARIAAAAAQAARQAAVDDLARLYADPVDPKAVVAALNRAIIDFRPGSSDLPADAAGFIQAAAEVIQRAPEGAAIVVAGHIGPATEATDTASAAEATGATAVVLAEARAQAVVAALVEAGVEPARLVTETRGGDPPDTTEDSEDSGDGTPRRKISFSLAEAPEIEPAADSLVSPDDPAEPQSDSMSTEASEPPTGPAAASSSDSSSDSSSEGSSGG